MEASLWLPLQALGTMAIVIGLAYWSWRRTRKMKDRGLPRKPSALARETPDPQFQPDREVTDPFHVADGHKDEEARDRERKDGRPNSEVPNSAPRPNREARMASAGEAQENIRPFKAR